MKVFTHKPLPVELPDLNTESLDGKRYYITPENNVYPSITTVLSVLSEEAIEQWRERVGEEAADKISSHASGRGTDLHAVIESYLKNEPLNFPADPRSLVRIMFNRMKRPLDRIDNILAQEIALYSDKLATAGRSDVVGEYEGVPSIIDFKGSTKAKKKSYIDGYFMQGTGYALMFEERTGIKIEQVVILMCGENDFSCQVFKENREKWIEPLKQTIDRFIAKQTI